MKSYLLIFIFSLFSVASNGQSQIRDEKGKWSGSYKNIDGILHPDGYGTYEYSWGDKFIGTITDDNYFDGEYLFADGNKFIGSSAYGKKVLGKFCWTNGQEYDGEWYNELPHGKGVIIYNNGDKYEGQFKAGQKHGKGTYYFADGKIKIGIWKDNALNGECEIYYPNGGYYTGGIIDGKLHGYGRYEYSNGSVYIGEWEKGRKNGYGTLYYSPNDYFQGQFKKGKKDGEGLFVFNNGDYVIGTWKQDSLVHIEYQFDTPQEISKEYTDTAPIFGLDSPINNNVSSNDNSNLNSSLSYNGFPVMPINQMMYLDPADVTQYCNQFPGGINILLDPNFAMLQVQQQMLMQQQQQRQFQNYVAQRLPEMQEAMMNGVKLLTERQNHYASEMQKSMEQSRVFIAQQVAAERDIFISNFKSMNPGATDQQAMTAYANYCNEVTASRQQTHQVHHEEKSHKYERTGGIHTVGETIEYVGLRLSDEVYCKKCDKIMQRHYHKKLTYYSPW